MKNLWASANKFLLIFVGSGMATFTIVLLALASAGTITWTTAAVSIAIMAVLYFGAEFVTRKFKE